MDSLVPPIAWNNVLRDADFVEMRPVYPLLCVDLNMFGLQSVVHNDRIQCIEIANGLLVVAGPAVVCLLRVELVVRT